MKRLQWLVGVIVFSAVLGVFAWGPAFIHRLEFQTYDWRFRLRGQQEPKAPVSIVAIDARSVDELASRPSASTWCSASPRRHRRSSPFAPWWPT